MSELDPVTKVIQDAIPPGAASWAKDIHDALAKAGHLGVRGEMAVDQRGLAVEKVASWLYARNASQAAPGWDEAGPMTRYSFLETANELTNKVFEHLAPTPPSFGVLKLQLDIFCEEAWARRDALSSEQVLAGLTSVIRDSTVAGVNNEENNDD